MSLPNVLGRVARVDNMPAHPSRVLVVDDEPLICRFVDQVLAAAGYQTTASASGEDALRTAAKLGDFELLVTDLRMPGIDGSELARRLRLTRPDLKVLYLTGFSDVLFDSKATLWEHEAFLEKPTTKNGLLEAVSILLVGRLTTQTQETLSADKGTR